jgi:D-amino-acid dehydrogenase
LGQQLRVAGTIELGGFDLRLDTAEQGGDPHFWCGLRPATPTNIPLIGRTGVGKLWVNAGHGTLGWTHGAGSGKALASLIDGQTPDIAFAFA